MTQTRLPSGHNGFMRHVVESLLFLSIAVMVCRVFFAEGFMISTGSMAPSLLGYHRQVVCPDCGYHFARGARYPDDLNWSSEAIAQDLAGDTTMYTTTICPNCLTSIDASVFPINEGDQLMVHKHAYEWRDPGRWEVIVFRNPGDATQPFVKRVAGLPGEVVEIRSGDIYADGQLQRKPMDVQRGIRILVDDHDHQPDLDDPNVEPRWIAARGETTYWNDARGVLSFSDQAEHDAPEQPEAAGLSFDWMAFRHWVREGGEHLTQVALDVWPANLYSQEMIHAGVIYDADRQRLECIGALNWSEYQRWRARNDSPEWQSAWDELFRESHCPAINDVYGYNHPDTAGEGYDVRDVMVVCEIEHHAGEGIFIVRLTDGSAIFDCEFDFGHHEVRLYANNRPEAVRTRPMPAEMLSERSLVEFSIFDQQVSLAVNSSELFVPLRYSNHSRSDDYETTDIGEYTVISADAPRRPVLLGAENLSLDVRHLRVYRDVYYTQKVDAPESYVLGEDEFFVLGDNSPVSADSRAWEDPAVSRDMLIGKPLVVHLPSQQWPLTWGGETHFVRIPDPTRIRWIR